MTVSVVVPSYEGRALLRANLPSILRALAAYAGDGEVLVVDDGSRDDTQAILRAEFPEVRVERHETNRGFGTACLTGARSARHPIVVLLNSDVRVEESFLAPLVAPFERDADVFSVSPLVLDPDGRPDKTTVNHPVLRRGQLRWRGVPPEDLLRLSRLDPALPLEIRSLFGLGGAIAFVRERFLALGGFDPLYRPFYHEDVDLGLMAWRRGWKVLVEPRSRVVHAAGSTINRHHSPLRVKVARRRHRILCGWKHAEGAWRRDLRRSLTRQVLTKWLRLDVRFYLALAGAFSRRAEALAARTREEREGSVALVDVFPSIAETWPPAVRPTEVAR